MDENQFARRLLALLQQNPNIDLGEAIARSGIDIDRSRITQFRHYRGEDLQQAIKLLIPALIEKAGVEAPSLVEALEYYCPTLVSIEQTLVPALIFKTQAEYGIIPILYYKAKFYEQHPDELCTCRRYQPLNGRCELSCTGNGEFETLEECNNFRLNLASGNSYRYWSFSNYSDPFQAIRRSDFVQYQGDFTLNAYTVFTLSGIPIVGCDDIRVVYSEATANEPRWRDTGGTRYADSQVRLYYAGSLKKGAIGMELEYGFGARGDDYALTGMTGYGDIVLLGDAPPPTGAHVFVVGDARFLSGYLRYWQSLGQLAGYFQQAIPHLPPRFADNPTPWPEAASPLRKYCSLQLYLGGDREEPLLLGEYLTQATDALGNSAGTPFDFRLFDSRVQTPEPGVLYKDYEHEDLIAGKNLYPAWTRIAPYSGATGYTHALQGDVNLGAIYKDAKVIRTHMVALSQNQRQICVKYGVFAKHRSVNPDGSRQADFFWCHIDIINVSGRSISKKTYKYPEAVVVDPRNWARGWCASWLFAENRLAVYRPINENNDYGGINNIYSSDDDLLTLKAICDSFEKKAMLSYLRGHFEYNLGLTLAAVEDYKASPAKQFWECGPYPSLPEGIHPVGCNFAIQNDKAIAFDSKPNQCHAVTVGDKIYQVPLAEAVHRQNIEAYIRYGECAANGAYSELYDTNLRKTFGIYGNNNLDTDVYLKTGYETVRAKVFKIPGDSVIVEISPYVEGEKESVIEPKTIYIADFQFDIGEYWMDVSMGRQQWSEDFKLPGIKDANFPNYYPRLDRYIQDFISPVPWVLQRCGQNTNIDKRIRFRQGGDTLKVIGNCP